MASRKLGSRGESAGIGSNQNTSWNATWKKSGSGEKKKKSKREGETTTPTQQPQTMLGLNNRRQRVKQLGRNSVGHQL
jgi:hypothetical protein